MFSAPMFRYEYRATTRKRRPFVFRSLIGVGFVVALLFVGFLVFTANPQATLQEKLLISGRSVFVATFCLQMVFLTFFVPIFVAGSIAEERAKDTLPLLLLTRLRPFEIVVTKMAARGLSVINLILTGLPLLVVSAWFAGLELEMFLALIVLGSSTAFMAALAILASAARAQPATARAQATGWIFGWLIGLPVISIIPARTTDLWGMLLTELKQLCALFAPSSPLSLVTDTSWYTGTGSLTLEMRVALMVAIQVVLGLLAMVSAASRLNARERNPNWMDATRGYRTPCGDDPIYWREYELPYRRGGGPLFMIRLRYLWIMIQAFFLNMVGILVGMISLAVPIGLLFATVYYGFAAFQELWQSSSTGPYVDRLHFNLLVRAATGLLALFPSMTHASLVGARITMERDKKTWDALLTTPLTGREILWSKTYAALSPIRSSWPLLIIWLLGLACGVVTFLGVFLAAVDLVLVTWAFLALAIHQGLRPGPTNAATTGTSSGIIILFFLHIALLGGLLASPRELAGFDAWDARIRWGIGLTGLWLMIVTGIVAWHLTRRTVNRFDEWAGRPIKKG